LADRIVGRTVASVEANDAFYIKDGNSQRTLTRAITGRTVTGTRRIGKLLLVDTDGPTLGMRFGMTGRLVVDGVAGVDQLMYTSRRKNSAWDRFAMTFTDGSRLAINDPRRLGGVGLDPREAYLGPDAKDVTVEQLRVALASDAPLKARLLNQARLAGVGNLIADEVLWRAGLAPERLARTLSEEEVESLHGHLRTTLRDLQRRGGSNKGDLIKHRKPGGRCPLDGAELRRATVGGRTTWSCPEHQR
jgi:formamidopyrimidine-DNA glycosylase